MTSPRLSLLIAPLVRLGRERNRRKTREEKEVEKRKKKEGPNRFLTFFLSSSDSGG